MVKHFFCLEILRHDLGDPHAPDSDRGKFIFAKHVILMWFHHGEHVVFVDAQTTFCAALCSKCLFDASVDLQLPVFCASFWLKSYKPLKIYV